MFLNLILIYKYPVLEIFNVSFIRYPRSVLLLFFTPFSTWENGNNNELLGARLLSRHSV